MCIGYVMHYRWHLYHVWLWLFLVSQKSIWMVHNVFKTTYCRILYHWGATLKYIFQNSKLNSFGRPLNQSGRFNQKHVKVNCHWWRQEWVLKTLCAFQTVKFVFFKRQSVASRKWMGIYLLTQVGEPVQQSSIFVMCLSDPFSSLSSATWHKAGLSTKCR
jgi:hypothetical protein